MANNPLLALAGLSSNARDTTAQNAQDTALGNYKDTYVSPLMSLLPRPSSTGVALTPGAPGSFDGSGSSAPSADMFMKLAQPQAAIPSATGSPMPASTDGSDDKGDKVRAAAWQAFQRGQSQYTQALNTPAPQYQAPQTSPLAGLGLALLGGFMNAQSPYSSEGSRFLDSYTKTRDAQAQNNYQNALQQYNAALARGQAQYGMAKDTAQPLFTQASDEANAASEADRLAKTQAFQLDLQQKGFNHQDATNLADQIWQTEQVKTKLLNDLAVADKQGQIADQHTAYSALLNQAMANPQARRVLATDTLLKHGYDPTTATQLGLLMAKQTPDELAQGLKNDADATRLEILKQDAKTKPLIDQANLKKTYAEIASIQAGTGQTAKATDQMGTLTDKDAYEGIKAQLAGQNAAYLKAVGDLATYKEHWLQTHKPDPITDRLNASRGLPPAPAPDISQDSTYNQLSKVVMDENNRRETITKILNKALGGKFGLPSADNSNPGFPAPGWNGNARQFGNGITVKRIGN
jgi:hypothetical protein